MVQRFVEEVLETIELDEIKDSIVGTPGGRGLSIEQRKRLTIAVELVSNPSIIFMDEPTSGLDARSAAIVMRAVKNVVATGRTTVCTIHQPSIDVFEAFDKVFSRFIKYYEQNDERFYNCICYTVCTNSYFYAADSNETRRTYHLLRTAGDSFKQAHRIF